MSTETPTPPEALQGKNEAHVPWLLRRIWDRLNVNNEHFMGVIVGQEGSGKSYTAIRIAEEVDPTFTHERVLFEVVDLLKRLKDGEHEPGQFYVLDEAGVQLGRRTWQERSQVLANQALQLIRKHNLGLIFTLPRLSEFDSQAEGRLQAAFEITEKEDGEYVRGKWKNFDPDRMDESGQIYRKFPRRRLNGRKVRVKSLAFRPPSQSIVEPYEAEKDEFMKDFYEEVIEEFEEADEEAEADSQTPKDIAVEIARDGVGEYVSLHGQTNQPYINKELIRADYEISHSDARTVKSLLERRFDLEEIENNA